MAELGCLSDFDRLLGDEIVGYGLDRRAGDFTSNLGGDDGGFLRNHAAGEVGAPGAFFLSGSRESGYQVHHLEHQRYKDSL